MEDIDRFTLRLLSTAESNAAAVQQLKPYGYRYMAPASTTNVENSQRKRKRDEQSSDKKISDMLCNHCGWRNHETKDCSYPGKNPTHPYINKDPKTLWVNSDQGKAFIAKHPGKTRYEPEKKKPKKGKELSCINHEVLSIINPIILNTSDSEGERKILTLCAPY